MTRSLHHRKFTVASAAGLLLTTVVACSDNPGTNGAGGAGQTGGGSPASGGQQPQAGAAGQASQGGSSSATAGSGGASSAGSANGGSANGGSANGGGTAQAGAGGSGGAGGNETAGGGGNGGTPGGGSGPGTGPSFYIGADVTFEESQPEATRANLLSSLKAHGFNAIRLRAFVDPRAADGYDKTNGVADTAHTAAFGKQIKAAGMALLVDFHYSNNWADPGKQCVPIAWQQYTTIEQLAGALHDYTKDAITQMIAAGARPDMVQIGNEITPGMLLHRCDSGGQPTGMNPVTGSSSNWPNLGALLKAGVDAVKQVDPTILTSFHIDRGGDKASDTPGAALETSLWWLTNAVKYATPDAFGESTYQRYQGDPNSPTKTQASWTSTFAGLASAFPNIKFFSAEYGPMQKEINDVLFAMPNEQGIGTFNWEPTTQGDWNSPGHDLLRRSGSTYTAQPDLAKYDQMKIDYASRL